MLAPGCQDLLGGAAGFAHSRRPARGFGRSRIGTVTPERIRLGGRDYEIRYLPAASDTDMFDGSSNSRGPIWFPMSLVILHAPVQLHRFDGDRLKVEYRTSAGPGEDPVRGRAR
jgi:hypothetical protein